MKWIWNVAKNGRCTHDVKLACQRLSTALLRRVLPLEILYSGAEGGVEQADRPALVVALVDSGATAHPRYFRGNWKIAIVTADVQKAATRIVFRDHADERLVHGPQTLIGRSDF